MFNTRIVALIGAGLLVLLTAVAIPNLVENLSANDVMVIQSLSGKLTCYTEPGPKWQGLGRVTEYPRRGTYDFSRGMEEAASGSERAKDDNSKKIRFNDGGHADLYGKVNWTMPSDCQSIIALHRTFGSTAGLEENGIAQSLNSAIYLSGPLMSSTESSAERRAELTQLIDDQAQHGTYLTTTHQVEKPDPITGEKKSVAEVEILKDSRGLPLRQSRSILDTLHIGLQPMAIGLIRYDNIVEAQIAQRQKATTQVQIAIANAKKAEQDAITIAKEGEAEATKARWEQEKIKATAVTEAQQKLEVQTLAAREAEQYKREQVLRGEGEAERRRLVMSADGALDAKLQAYIKVQQFWADAFSKYTGAMVPSVMTGNAGSASALGSAQNFVELMTVKTARDLGLDLQNAGKGKTAREQ